MIWWFDQYNGCPRNKKRHWLFQPYYFKRTCSYSSTLNATLIHNKFRKLSVPTMSRLSVALLLLSEFSFAAWVAEFFKALFWPGDNDSASGPKKSHLLCIEWVLVNRSRENALPIWIASQLLLSLAKHMFLTIDSYKCWTEGEKTVTLLRMRARPFLCLTYLRVFCQPAIHI